MKSFAVGPRPDVQNSRAWTADKSTIVCVTPIRGRAKACVIAARPDVPTTAGATACRAVIVVVRIAIA